VIQSCIAESNDNPHRPAHFPAVLHDKGFRLEPDKIATTSQTESSTASDGHMGHAMSCKAGNALGIEDIYFAEKKILSALPKMAKAAQSEKLKAAFEKHETETEEHVARLEKVFEEIDESPRGKTCDAIMGIIEEGQEIMKEFKGAPALDAGLLAAAPGRRTLRDCPLRHSHDLGQELGLNQSVKLFLTTLGEEKKTDQTLTQLAESQVNSVRSKRPSTEY
jgi:ferritin-like metal-binding protein YciE